MSWVNSVLRQFLPNGLSSLWNCRSDSLFPRARARKRGEREENDERRRREEQTIGSSLHLTSHPHLTAHFFKRFFLAVSVKRRVVYRRLERDTGRKILPLTAGRCNHDEGEEALLTGPSSRKPAIGLLTGTWDPGIKTKETQGPNL